MARSNFTALILFLISYSLSAQELGANNIFKHVAGFVFEFEGDELYFCNRNLATVNFTQSRDSLMLKKIMLSTYSLNVGHSEYKEVSAQWLIDSSLYSHIVDSLKHSGYVLPSATFTNVELQENGAIYYLPSVTISRIFDPASETHKICFKRKDEKEVCIPILYDNGPCYVNLDFHQLSSTEMVMIVNSSYCGTDVYKELYLFNY